ncbi:unnamed protein product [Pocillopora meandrina]|uniref:Uncharacterized protein n=1 Tax=Pocillopora meandrina TaxID=46732 RepID=A0AAU9XLP4_9CNID|nr:unnamed protein product [Pocillopora meandrina]
MNMPCLSRAAYYKQVDVILEALESEAKEELKEFEEWRREHVASGDCDINLKEVHLLWKQKELLFFGIDPSNFIT